MSITLGNITKCLICGEEPNTMTHVCAWEEAMDEKIVDVICQPSKEQYDAIKSTVRHLLLDAYHRGRKDGMSNLTMQQELNLQNLFRHLGDARSEIRAVLFPTPPQGQEKI